MMHPRPLATNQAEGMQKAVKRKATTDEQSSQLKRRQIARERWNILIETIHGQRTSQTQQSVVSVRRFQSYGLLQTQKIKTPECENETEDASWYQYSCHSFPNLSLIVRHLSETIKPSDLLGFNNTGNVCVWPSEEVMTYYCLQNHDKFADANVIEVGGGMTCLAGMAVATCSKASRVVLTDGNEQSISNLRHIIGQNKTGGTSLSARMLRWGPTLVDQDLKEQFDIVLCADCLFFDEGRKHLVQTLHSLLKPKGEAWIFAPSRHKTFYMFTDLAKNFFDEEQPEVYDTTVWRLHKQLQASSEVYDENLHFPLFVRLIKGDPTNDSRDTTPESR
ncbi:hypothetical protein C0Q70_13224 [Pomacea canaliculata]|uniref:Calmodulin-lysine N-methyltransferase n=1 Tax=Pomacea canaliculata TaxID=400727 RepID=A0A2T7NWM5_POMCA|nr:calmodulin-lysine N-methyltransferase-like [Pomacea canaliculata]PVD25568.1 hypothetical protein C0Q70_13224 [Pomacea canaliculata]